MPARPDLGTPPDDAQQVTSESFPTPSIEDVVITEDVSARTATARPIPIGTPHDKRTTAKLVWQGPQPGDNTRKRVRRIYANDRSAQDAYNYELTYSGDSKAHPIYTRTYYFLRDGYTPANRLATLSCVLRVTITSGGTSSGGDRGTGGRRVLTFSGGGGTGAAGYVQMVDGVVVSAWLTAAGSGYTSAPTVGVVGPTSGLVLVAVIQPVAAVLVDERESRVDGELGNLFVRVTRTYETLPGPVISTFRFLKTGYTEKTTAQRVVATTLPGSGTRDEVIGQTSVVALRRLTITVNSADGTTSSEEPIYIFEKIVPEQRCTQITYEQASANPATPVLDLHYGSAGVWAANTIASITVTRAGSGYTTVPTVTIAAPAAGGTQATATARLGAVTSVFAGGSGYSVNDLLTATGGTFTTAAQFRASGGAITAISVLAPGTGYVVGDRITLAGGTASTAAIVIVDAAGLASVVITNGGTGHTAGDVIELVLNGTTTTPAVITVLTVDGGGAILTCSVTTHGIFTTTPTSATPDYGAGGTHTSGSGLVLGAITLGIGTVIVPYFNQYSALASSYTAGLTNSLLGTGATFDSATVSLIATVEVAGSYSVTPSNPVTITGGTGTGGTMTVTYGVSAVVVTNAGAGYYTDFPAVTFSGAHGAKAKAIGDTAGWRSVNAYIIDGRVEDIEGSSLRRKIWTTAPVPFTLKEFPAQAFTYPALFTFTAGTYAKPLVARAGVNFHLTGHRPCETTARLTIESQIGHWSDLAVGFAVTTPGTASRIFPIQNNTIHAAFNVSEDDFYARIAAGTNGGIYTPLLTEVILASTPPSYATTDILLVKQWEKWLWGNIYQRFTLEVCEAETPI